MVSDSAASGISSENDVGYFSKVRTLRQVPFAVSVKSRKERLCPSASTTTAQRPLLSFVSEWTRS